MHFLMINDVDIFHVLLGHLNIFLNEVAAHTLCPVFSLCFPGPLIHSSQNCPGGHGFHSPFFYSGHGCQEEINLLQPNEIWASQHWPLMKNALMASIRKLVLSVPEGTFK